MIRHPLLKEYSIYLTYSLLLMSASPVANAISLKLAENINFSGSLGHQLSYIKTGERSPVVSNTSSLHLNAATFLWQPWIATVNSNLTMSYLARQNGDDTTGQNLTGGINFHIFPQSHFPLRTYFRRANNLIEGDLLDQNTKLPSLVSHKVIIPRQYV